MTMAEVRTVSLPSGEPMPALGQGAWYLGDRPERRAREIAALRLGLDLGLSLIDTAEMYGNGASERLVGEAIAGRRDDVFLVSKVLPHNANRDGTVAACEASLRRLGTDRLDLYLLHWPGPHPLPETVAAFEELVAAGKIRHWGVSNFDLDELPDGPVAADQVLYNLSRRGIEHDLLPACRRRGLPIMAYTPIEQGRILGHSALRRIARRHEATPAGIAIAWVLRQDGVVAIPRTGNPEHVRDNRTALDIRLTDEDLAELDQAFPPPTGPSSLEML
jgi:diketogulonate reductase-like aldo/keto reductase